MSLLAHSLAIAIAVLLACWLVGGLLLRLGGATVVLFGLLAALAAPIAMLLVVPGAVLWAAGHWHYALRHHTYKSPLAERLFLQLLPTPWDPTRNWRQANKNNNDD